VRRYLKGLRPGIWSIAASAIGGRMAGTFGDCERVWVSSRGSPKNTPRSDGTLVMGHSAGGQLGFAWPVMNPASNVLFRLAVWSICSRLGTSPSTTRCRISRRKSKDVSEHYHEATRAAQDRRNRWLIHGAPDDSVPASLPHYASRKSAWRGRPLFGNRNGQA